MAMNNIPNEYFKFCISSFFLANIHYVVHVRVYKQIYMHACFNRMLEKETDLSVKRKESNDELYAEYSNSKWLNVKELNERRIQSRKNADERRDTVKEESMIKNERGKNGRMKRMVCLNFFIFSCSYGYT